MNAISQRKFTGRTDANQVVRNENLRGKLILVTGGTSGIGTATVETLAGRGAHVIFTGRNVDAAKDLIASIKTVHPSAQLDFMPLNLASFKDVQRFAEAFLAQQSKLDVIIFNAGTFGGRTWKVTDDGYEATIQVNVLSQLYLLQLLRNLLVRSTPTRIVLVSSNLHKVATISPSNLSEMVLSPNREHYSAWKQYANSKLCQVLLASYLQSIWDKDGITFFSLHPGSMIATGLGRSFLGASTLMFLARPFTKTLQQGAATSVYCAVSEDVKGHGGKYFEDCWIGQKGRHAGDLDFAHSVFRLCEKMIQQKVIGFQFDSENG